MSNKDMPAYPGNHKRIDVRDSNGDPLYTDEVRAAGLTKLEAFTKAFGAGLCVGRDLTMTENEIALIARTAIEIAEAALAELEGRG